MKVCFHAPTGPSSDSLRRAAQEVFGAIDDLGNAPANRWREAITKADLAILDITAGNPAASYLTGLADALGKRILLLAPTQESISSIFNDRLVIVHQWNFEHLRAELRKFAAPNSSPDTPAILDDTPAGKFQQMFGDLLRSHGYIHRGPVEFDGTAFTLREQDMDLALVQAVANRAKSLNLRVRLL